MCVCVCIINEAVRLSTGEELGKGISNSFNVNIESSCFFFNVILNINKDIGIILNCQVNITVKTLKNVKRVVVPC